MRRCPRPVRLSREWVPPVADRQGGLFTPTQALEAGATPDQVRHRRRTRRWIRVVGDAFALEGARLEPTAPARGAVLTWPDAVVCRSAAALLHHLPVPDPNEVDVIVPLRRRGRHGLRTHQVHLADHEVTRIAGIPVTSLTRTIGDCLGTLDQPAVDGLVAWVVARRLLDAPALTAVLRSRLGSWGNAGRRRAMPFLVAGAASVAELRLHELLRRQGFTGWEPNTPIMIRGRIAAVADVLFADRRLVVEVDGRSSHADRFQRDRERDAMLVAAGYAVLRFTWDDVVLRPDRTADTIRQALSRP